jgi:hypothetical protein
MKKLLLSLLFALPLVAWATAPTPQGSVAVALDQSNAYAFLKTDSNGYLLTSGTPSTLNAYSLLSNITSAPALAISNTQLILGVPGYVETGYNLGQLTVPSATQGNLYAQFSIQGLNAGSAASTDFVATADNGTMTTHYVNMGINSSGNSTGTYPTGANLAYLETVSDDLYVGTVANKTLRFFANSVDTEDVSAASGFVFNPIARTTGSASYYTFNAPADTGLATTVESIGRNLVGSTRTWVDGTTAVQRETVFAAPTYNKTTTSAVFTQAATVAITAAPIAGTGVTITNPYALWVQAGNAKFDGGVTNTGNETITPASRTTAAAVTPYFQVTTPADTAITTATAATGVNFATGTRTWVDGTVAAQTEFLFNAPTYNKTTTSATFTKAATLAVSAAPIAGASVTITNPYALWVEAGVAQFDGDLTNTGVETLTPAARSSGVVPYFQLTIPTDTSITASTEGPGFKTVTGTRTWATTGTVALQREYLFAAPTYASAGASQTFTKAATVDISGPPIQGSQAILSNPVALNVETGPSSFGGTYTFSTNPATTGASAIVVPAATTTLQTSEPVTFQQVYLGQPTYAAASGTITTASNLYIAGAPIASTLTITNPYALDIAAGQSSIGGAYTYGALPSGAWAWGTTLTFPAATYTGTGTNTATTGAVIYHGIPTFTDASVGTVTDLTDELFLGPTAIAGSQAATRVHSLAIQDSTSSTTAVTGAFVVASTLGTAAGSVGIGAGNIYAGNNLTVAGASTFNGSASTSPVTITPTARTSVWNPYLKITAAADTGMTASTAFPGVQVLTATRTWGSGTIPTQGEVEFDAPTYAGTSGTNTVTQGATVYINNAPIVGSNAAITTGYGLLIGGTAGLGVGSAPAANSGTGMVQRFRNGFATAGQGPSATTRTYITGSDVGPFTAGQLQVGTMIHWHMNITKTGAGTATATFDIAFGTTGSTSDNAQVSFTKPVGVGNVDQCTVDIYAVVKTNSASGVVIGDFTLLDDQTGAGGFLAAGKYVSSLTTTSGTFNTTTPTHVGLCVTTGTSDVWTINAVETTTANM